jgi:hypothetical protein
MCGPDDCVTVSPVMGEATANPVGASALFGAPSRDRIASDSSRTGMRSSLSACIMATTRGYSHLDNQREAPPSGLA